MKRFGIIGAMESEIELLKKYFKGGIFERAGLQIYDGKIFDKPVVFACAGVGKVNASLCTQVLISDFNAELIINCGIAGAVSEELSVLDFVVSEKAFQHDFDVTHFGYSLGQIPETESPFWYGNKELISASQKAFEKLCKGDFSFDTKKFFENDKTTIKDFNKAKFLVGTVATGDVFVASDALQNRIKSICKESSCVEMEGAAIAQVASLNAVPFIILRSISDSADELVEKISYDEFATRAAKMAASLILQLLYDWEV